MPEKVGRMDSQSGIAGSKAKGCIFVIEAFKLQANFSTNKPSLIISTSSYIVSQRVGNATWIVSFIMGEKIMR